MLATLLYIIVLLISTFIAAYVINYKKKWLDSIIFWKFVIVYSFLMIFSGFFLAYDLPPLILLGFCNGIIYLCIAIKWLDSLKKDVIVPPDHV